ncbi:MAG: hypothetical protein ACKV2Q_14480, partial [Planctomycetaceae bacterium]
PNAQTSRTCRSTGDVQLQTQTKPNSIDRSGIRTSKPFRIASDSMPSDGPWPWSLSRADILVCLLSSQPDSFQAEAFSVWFKRGVWLFSYPPNYVNPGFYRFKILNGVARWG